MSQIGESLMILGFQGLLERERKARTLLDLVRKEVEEEEEDMGSEERRRGGRLWKNLKERLGFKGIGCCGATWGANSTFNLTSIREDDDEDLQSLGHVGQIPVSTENSPSNLVWVVGQIPAVDTGMNLATALAAERNFRSAEGGRPSLISVAPSTPLRVSLMRLLQETDGVDGEKKKEKLSNIGDNDTVCCVCMERRKGAAFIPCGHTFCRVCTRDIWLNRGSCAICNRSIVEILDIF